MIARTKMREEQAKEYDLGRNIDASFRNDAQQNRTHISSSSFFAKEEISLCNYAPVTVGLHHDKVVMRKLNVK